MLVTEWLLSIEGWCTLARTYPKICTYMHIICALGAIVLLPSPHQSQHTQHPPSNARPNGRPSPLSPPLKPATRLRSAPRALSACWPTGQPTPPAAQAPSGSRRQSCRRKNKGRYVGSRIQSWGHASPSCTEAQVDCALRTPSAAEKRKAESPQPAGCLDAACPAVRMA